MSTFDHADLTHNIGNALKNFRQSQSQVMQNFYQLAQSSMVDGAIDAKTKELIALAIGVTQKCSGCIGFHVQALNKLGATRAELDEMLGICVYMGGGPALMYCAEAIDAWEKLAVKTA